MSEDVKIMSGDVKADDIRCKNDVTAELVARNRRLEEELAIARDNELMLKDQIREMAATERACTEDINRFLVERGMMPIKKDQLGMCTESALDAIKRLYDKVHDDRLVLEDDRLAFALDRRGERREHKATMFALITFGILMVTCTICLVSMAVG